jgi:hypothetical protein
MRAAGPVGIVRAMRRAIAALLTVPDRRDIGLPRSQLGEAVVARDARCARRQRIPRLPLADESKYMTLPVELANLHDAQVIPPRGWKTAWISQLSADGKRRLPITTKAAPEMGRPPWAKVCEQRQHEESHQGRMSFRIPAAHWREPVTIERARRASTALVSPASTCSIPLGSSWRHTLS